MAYSKVIQIGSAGSLSLSEAGGVVSVSLSVGEATGGSIAGAGKVSASVQGSLSGVEVVDALLKLVASLYPALSVEIAAFEAVLNAALAKV
jgi:hypothetical protein